MEKIAFGKANDAVKLMFEPTDIDTLDLFLVAEMKLTKDKSLEIKFFDRLKALEKLSDTDDHRVSDFYAALLDGDKENNPDEV